MKVSDVLLLYEAYNSPMNFNTKKNYSWAVKSLTEAVGDVEIGFLGMDHILLWKAKMHQRGVEPTSINTKIGKIRSLLRFASEHEMDVLDYRQIRREKEVYKPKTWLLPEEIDRLVDAASNVRDEAIIKGYFATGCRLSEFLGVDRADFEAAERKILDGEVIYKFWVCGKGDKYRAVCMDEATKKHVDAYLKTRHDRFRPLFMSAQNNRLGCSTVEKMLHKVARKAGLTKRVTPHVLRHSFASDLAVGDAPVIAISNLLGHAKVSTTMNIYTHITDKQAEMAYAIHKQKNH